MSTAFVLAENVWTKLNVARRLALRRAVEIISNVTRAHQALMLSVLEPLHVDVQRKILNKTDFFHLDSTAFSADEWQAIDDAKNMVTQSAAVDYSAADVALKVFFDEVRRLE